MNATVAKFPRNPWPIFIVAYFIVFITFIVLFIIFASRQKMDLVRGDYYDEEIRYQEQLDRMNRTQQINAQTAIAYDFGRQTISISLPAIHAHRPVTGRIRLYRPSDDTLDRDVPLAVNSDGRQSVDASNLQPGLWKIRVYWTVDGRDYFSGESVVVGRDLL
jgi:nitrogen fixation protein FixH